MNKRRGRPPKYLSNPPKPARRKGRKKQTMQQTGPSFTIGEPSPSNAELARKFPPGGHKAAFHQLSATEIQELLLEELVTSARQYIAYWNDKELDEKERHAIATDWGESVRAVNELVGSNSISLNLLVKLMGLWERKNAIR